MSDTDAHRDTDTGDIHVVDAPAASRFEIHVGDELAGFVTYRRHPDYIVFVHTEIFDKWEGHGLGSKLARAVLDQARAEGLRVVPRCPFVAAYIKGHAEYADLVRP
jgi:predicted GNAT family acetyltransferase